MDYGIEVKNARMGIVRDAIAGGLLEIGTAGMKSILVAIPIGIGAVDGGVLTAPISEAVAQVDGDAAVARVRSRVGSIAIDHLSVGKQGQLTDVALATTRIGAGAVVTGTGLTLAHG